MSGLGGEEETLTDLDAKCSVLLQEMSEVLAEGKDCSSEQCDKAPPPSSPSNPSQQR